MNKVKSYLPWLVGIVAVGLVGYYVIRPLFLEKYFISHNYASVRLPNSLTLMSSEWRGPLEIDVEPNSWHFLYQNQGQSLVLNQLEDGLRSQGFSIEKLPHTQDILAVNASKHLQLSVSEEVSDRGNKSRVDIAAKDYDR